MNTTTHGAFFNRLEAIRREVAAVSTVHVNSGALRETIKALVHDYFKTSRTKLIDLHLDVAEMDELLTALNRLASGRNPKKSYQAHLRKLLKVVSHLEIAVASMEAQEAESGARAGGRLEETEGSIFNALEARIPTAGLSYRQAIIDLAQAERQSYRGVAAELREALREVLDHLAPDSEVEKAPGFKFESGLKRPTQRQKAKFILDARRVSSAAQGAPIEALLATEEIIAGFARSIYVRGSLSTHVGATREETIQLKRYIDVIFCEFLGVK